MSSLEKTVQEVNHTIVRCSIYGLSSTKDGVIRYIGQTIKPLPLRRGEHIADAKRSGIDSRRNSRCHRWIRKVLRSGFDIGIQLIEADCSWDVAEKRWIAFYRAKYPGLLTNLSNGGCGFAGKRSMATRLKMRKPKSETTKARMRKPKSPEMRAKLSLALRGNRRGIGEANGQSTLTEAAVIDIKRRLHRGESLTAIGAVYGVTKGTVWKIKAGYSWRHVDTSLDASLREDNGRHCQRGDVHS